MSFSVVAKVLEHSQQRLARRLILICIAEVSHDDGVGWEQQDAIARKALLSRTHVVEELRAMEREGVIEVRKARRGRRKFNIYRLVELPGLPPVDYARIPYELDAPFTSELPTSSSDEYVGSAGSTTSEIAEKSKASPLIEPPLEPSLPPDGGDGGGELVPSGGANVVVGEFVDALRLLGHDPAGRVKSQLARNVKALLDEGRTLDEIRAGVARMVDRRSIRPDLLAHFVAEAAIGPGTSRKTETPAGAPTPTAMLEEIRQRREAEQA